MVRGRIAVSVIDDATSPQAGLDLIERRGLKMDIDELPFIDIRSLKTSLK